MSNINYESDVNVEKRAAPKPLEQLAIELAALNPKPVTYFAPDNLDEVMEDFLSKKIDNPTAATYTELDQMDFGQRADEYRQILDEILMHPDVPQKHRHVYESYVARNLKVNELMYQAVLYRTASGAEEKAAAREAFQALNKELYGDVEDKVARAMVEEILADTETAENPEIKRIRQEFLNLLPPDLRPQDEQVSLKPSQEVKDLAKRCVESIFHPLLRHTDRLIAELSKEIGVPEEDLELSPVALATIFQTIINSEFIDSGWRVEVKSANAINVISSEKLIVVPEQRAPVSATKARGLVVHELGVHMVRSIVGEGADLIPLRFGLAQYGDAEEGIATLMESVLTGDTARTGYQHYLTAALLGKGMDFRDAFEVMIRYKSLDSYLDHPEQKLKKNDKTTFKFMFRTVRGTNELSWLTNLSYFSGSHKIIEYLETHKDDPDLITLLFMGKIDPTNPDHLRAALDAKGRHK